MNPRLSPVYPVLLALLLSAPPAHAKPVPFSSDAWTIDGREHRVEMFDGMETLFLENGGAFLEEVAFLNGVIEFDLQVTPERGFSGGRWRIQDAGNYEDFYIRPHQSGKPDANQYQPVINGSSGWQIYFGPEYSAPVVYPYETWIHVRIEVLGDRAQVFIDSEEPVLVIDDLLREPAEGFIGVASGFAPARFANFQYELTDALTIAPAPERQAKPVPAGRIEQWLVSDAVDESSLDGETVLDPELMAPLSWHTLGNEPNGIANLARVQTHRNGPNTALVKLVLEADEATIQPIDFGFSDRVRAYTNGRLMYYGSDLWQSRDYRFLGTVGSYSTLYCPLNKGRNEIIFAISESFGGWAVCGNLVPVAGVRRVMP